MNRTYATTAIAPRPLPRRRGGLTLVELMVVILVLAILMGLAVGVGKFVFAESARKKTLSIQQSVYTAIERYREINGQWPAQTGGNAAARNHALWVELNAVPACRETLQELPPEALGEDGGDTVILDAWGQTMDYDVDGGMGERPVLISGGPDGALTGDDEDTADNVRSDRAGN